MKPLGGHPIEPGCEINWSSHLAAGLVALIMPMDGHGKSFVNMVTGQRAETTRGTVAYTPGPWGLCAGNGGGGLRMPVFDIHCYEASASLLMLGHMPPTWSAWERLASIGESPSARFLDVINDNGSSGLRIYAEGKDDSTQRSSPAPVITLRYPIEVGAGLASGERKPWIAIDGATFTASSPLSGNSTFPRIAVPGGMIDGSAGQFAWSLFASFSNGSQCESCGSPRSLNLVMQRRHTR